MLSSVNDNDAGDVLTQILLLQQSQQTLMRNRTLVNALMNGDTPYTDEEAQAENINTNVNFLQGSRICMNATNQVNRYFFGSDRFYTVRYERGPAAFRQRVGDVCTKLVNRELKKSRLYRGARESAHAQVVLHGPGAVVWRDRRSVLPTTAGIEDILIPSGTLCDMSNLDSFAIYRELVWSQLEEAAFGKVSDPGWNKGYVQALLSTLYGMGYQPIYQGNRWLFPEKLQEDYKEGASQTFSSSEPRVLAWDYFYRDEKSGKWCRKMVLDYANISTASGVAPKQNDAIMQNKQVLYSRDNYAEDWSEVLHWYVGNCSNVAPYRFHSVRSIGFLLYGVCLLSNKLMCRTSDHTFQQLLTWFRNVSEDNREKLGLIDLQNFGVMPDGVSMVGANERHVADWGLVQGWMGQISQLMAESSSSFVPDMQSALGSGGKELTATEALIRQNTSVTLTNAVLGQLGDQSLYEYREQWRRFCIKGNPDPVAKRFRDGLREEGVPLEVLDNEEAWEVLPEKMVGAGNKASELTVTQALLQEMYPLLDPNAQRIILRRRYTALTDNPDEAMAAVPDAPNAGAEDDVQYAQLAGTVLMAGMPWQDKEGVNHVIMGSVLMGVAQQAIQQGTMVVEQPDGVAIAAQKVAGAANVLSHVDQEIMKIGQAEALVPVAKQLKGQAEMLKGELGRLGSAIEAASQQAAQQGADGEMAKLQAKLMDIKATGDLNRQLAAESANQKTQQREAQWLSTTQQKNADTAAQIERDNAKTSVELRNSMVKAQADAQIAVLKEKAKPKPKAPASK